MPNSLYIHIPFCKQKCGYCDFYSIDYRYDLAVDYVNILCRQIREIPEILTTVYIGGGTPTMLDCEFLVELLDCLKNKLAVDCEFTVEANPESFTQEKAEAMFKRGVNRLSFGLQSLRENKLRFLGRPHTCFDGLQSLKIAAGVGFKNVSVDLIFGVENETITDLKQELQEYGQLSIQHISAYTLVYEPNTPLFQKIKNKTIFPITEQLSASMYRLVRKVLPLAGFKQYEISNFAKSGFACRHNLNYWNNGSYYGLGPAAVEYIDGCRRKNIANTVEFIKKYLKGESTVEFRETLDVLARAKETAAIKIRTVEGIDFTWFFKNTGKDLFETAGNEIIALIKEGFLESIKKDGKQIGIRLTGKGFLFCDEVSSRLV